MTKENKNLNVENSKKERVNSLKKDMLNEKKVNKKTLALPQIHKIKFDVWDIDKSYTTLLNKFSDYFNEKVLEYLSDNNIDLNGEQEIVENNLEKMIYTILPNINFNIEICSVEKEGLNKLISVLAKNIDINDIKTYYFCISSECGYIDVVIPFGDFKLPKKLRKNIYFLNDKKYEKNTDKILSIGDFFAFCYLIDTAINVLKESLSGKEEAKCIFVDAEDYNNTIIDNMQKFGDKKYTFSYPYNYHSTCHYIIEAFSILKEKEYNQILEEKYNKTITSDYASSFQDKKTVTNTISQIAKESFFNKYFEKLELDQDIDILKFKQIEKEYEICQTNIDIDKFFKYKKPTLRFRKLGKHKAQGIYFSHVNCVCIDIKSPHSFFHELAHAIDATSSEGRLSNGIDFMPLIYRYKKIFIDELENLTDEKVKKSMKNQLSYYFIHTEIFARSFELYLSQVKKMESSFLAENFNLKDGYILDNYFISKVKLYFDNLFKKYGITIKDNFSSLVSIDEVSTGDDIVPNNIIKDINDSDKENILDSKNKSNNEISSKEIIDRVAEEIKEPSKKDINLMTENTKDKRKTKTNDKKQIFNGDMTLYVISNKKNDKQLSFLEF